MPDEETIQRARKDEEEGKSPSTQAGEFVREEIHHIREGKHGAQSARQAIAIGLSKARRAGVELPPPKHGASPKVRAQARRDSRKGRESRNSTPSKVRSRAVSRALKREGRSAASKASLAKHARDVARQRGARSRHASAMKAIRTKGTAGMRRSGRKAAQTRTQMRKR
jgi:Family of unknown function (DUF6496)